MLSSKEMRFPDEEGAMMDLAQRCLQTFTERNLPNRDRVLNVLTSYLEDKAGNMSSELPWPNHHNHRFVIENVIGLLLSEGDVGRIQRLLVTILHA